MGRQAVAILSTENLQHNAALLRRRGQGAKLIGMVKANGYGHGIRSVSLRLQGHVDMLGVASIDEALALRKAGIRTPIMLAEGLFESSELLVAAAEKFHVVFHNALQLEWFEKSLLTTPLRAWIKINTGMGRLGFTPEEAEKAFRLLSKSPMIHPPIGIMSHFACAHVKEHPLNTQQIKKFTEFRQWAMKRGPFQSSLCNSGALFNFPEHVYEYIRPGLALYGISPLLGDIGEDLGLKPVMTLQSNIIAIQHLKAGESVGYGGRYVCPEDMPVGVVAFGYGDGYPITAQDGTPVLINNKICPLVGRVSMDMLTVDLRPCLDAKIGDAAILWGQGLPLETLTAYTQNIPYDLLTGVQHRVKFIWTREDAFHGSA